MGRRREYDYEVIEELLKECPELLYDLTAMVQEYGKRCGPSNLTASHLQRVIKRNAMKWIGQPAPQRKKGRRRAHDRQRVYWLRDEFPLATNRKLAALYNAGSTRRYLPAREVTSILKQRR